MPPDEPLSRRQSFGTDERSSPYSERERGAVGTWTGASSHAVGLLESRSPLTQAFISALASAPPISVLTGELGSRLASWALWRHEALGGLPAEVLDIGRDDSDAASFIESRASTRPTVVLNTECLSSLDELRLPEVLSRVSGQTIFVSERPALLWARLHPRLATIMRRAVVTLPTLSSRPEDIPLLVRAAGRQRGEKHVWERLDVRGRLLLQSFSWPLNERQLDDVIGRTLLETPTGVIVAQDLPLEVIFGTLLECSYAAAHQALDDYLLDAALRKGGRNLRKAAELLQVSYSTIKRRRRATRSPSAK